MALLAQAQNKSKQHLRLKLILMLLGNLRMIFLKLTENGGILNYFFEFKIFILS